MALKQFEDIRHTFSYMQAYNPFYIITQSDIYISNILKKVKCSLFFFKSAISLKLLFFRNESFVSSHPSGRIKLCSIYTILELHYRLHHAFNPTAIKSQHLHGNNLFNAKILNSIALYKKTVNCS
jgi:hypothetical protein